MLLAARRLAYRIVNPKIVHDRIEIKKDSTLPLYPIFGMKQTKTGIMVLNKPDNNNNVTEEMADELFRFLSSYHHDHTVENIWMENRGSSFSGGADLEALVNNPDYLDKLMRLSIKVGEFNKPIFAKVDGSVRGIGAYLVSMLSTPMATPNSSLRIDETAKGFVPIFGGSWRLSRLPCNIGIYLALTGDSLDADQMARLGFLRGKVRDEFTTKRIVRHLSDANLFMRNPYTPSSFTMSQVRRQNMILFRKNYFYDLLTETQKQIYRAGGSVNTKLALSQHRLAMTQYYNTINPYNSLSDKNSIVNNYFAMRHDRPFSYLKSKQIVEQGNTDNHLIARLPVPKLLKVFNRDDIKGVLQELQADGSDWAKKTQEMIRSKDPLAVNLAFKMIKNAKNMSWVECLDQEYKIARRILTISKATCRQISKDRSLIVLQNPHSKLKPEQIPKQTIQSFFRPAQTQLQTFSHDTPNHSLFPTSDYWRIIPDAARNYLNRTFFQDYHSKFGEVEVVRFLNQYKIDYRDSSYNIAKFREYLYKKLDWDRLVQLQRQRIRGIFQADVFYKQQKQQRKKYLQTQLKSPELPKLVAATIKQYFEEQFNSKFDELDKTSKIAGKQSRMEVLRKYAHTLTENIVFKGRKIEDVDRLSNDRHIGLVRFDEKGSDVRDAHTDVEKANHDLNTLHEAYKQGRDVSKLATIDPQKPKPIPERELINWEYDMLKKDTALQLNYGKTILPKQRARTYRHLMERAAKTSEQISAMLGWEDSDIQNVLINAPQKVVTFRQFAEQTLNKAPKIQERIQQLNKAYERYGQLKENQIPRILSPQQQNSTNNIFFNQKLIARPFREIHLALFEEVLNFYTQKYEIKNELGTGLQSLSKSKFLSRRSSQSLKEGFNKLMKSDVEYTFSYLVILHLKQILVEIQKSRPKNANELTNFLQNKFNLNFSGANWNQVNEIFMNYLYAMLDLHQQSKHKIIFPQTKMIEFLNKFKINAENNNRSTLSFESFMLLIARDRKMIRDQQNGRQPLLGYDPQINLNALYTQAKQNNKSSIEDDYYVSNNEKPNINNEPAFFSIDRTIQLFNSQQNGRQGFKKLVLGYQHYFRRFQAMLQQAAGDTMFLPKTLYECESKKTYEAVKDLLKIEFNQQRWLKSKIKSAVKNLMNFRLQKEKDMTQGQLRMFDEQFAQLFSSELIGLVLKYQCYHEELSAKLFLNDGAKTSPGTNDLIDNTYLEFMGEIKNSKSLKLLNTLIMSEQVVRARLQQIEQEQESGEHKQTQVTRQETIDLLSSRNRPINLRTYDRLISDALRYSEPVTMDKAAMKNTRNVLQKPKDTTDTLFMSELKQISQLLDGNDIRSELQNRIHRIETLYKD